MRLLPILAGLVMIIATCPVLADGVVANGEAAVTSCAATAAQLLRDKAMADGRVKTLTDALEAKEAALAALQRQIEARPGDAPK